MNRDDIIKMAREAGLTGLMEGGLIDYFERFAALVAAAEREECVKILEAEINEWVPPPDAATALRWAKDLIRARGEQ
jgi:hypothetical protein